MSAEPLNAMDKTLTVDLVKRLMTRNPNIRLLVKVRPTHAANGRDPHWGRARVVGFTGSELKLRPVAPVQHGQDIVVPADKVQINLGHNDSDTLALITSAREELLAEQARKRRAREAVEDAAVAAAIPHTAAIVTATIPIEENPMLMNNTTPAPLVEPAPRTPAPPAPPPAADLGQLLASYKELKQRIASEVSTGGLSRFRKLQADYQNALELAESIHQEIVDLVEQISEAGVEVPSELQTWMNADRGIAGRMPAGSPGKKVEDHTEAIDVMVACLQQMPTGTKVTASQLLEAVNQRFGRTYCTSLWHQRQLMRAVACSGRLVRSGVGGRGVRYALPEAQNGLLKVS
jgi:hypothetical protein